MRLRRDRRPQWAKDAETEALRWQHARALAGLCPVTMRPPGAISSFCACELGIGHPGPHRGDYGGEVSWSNTQAVESWERSAAEWWDRNKRPDGEPFWGGPEPQLPRP